MKHLSLITLVDWSVVTFAAIAAIAGAVGGCGAAGFMVVRSRSAVRVAQFFAYISIGIVSGLITFLFGSLVGVDTADTEVVIRWALVMGTAVPIALLSKNLVITFILKRLGWEIQFTIRKQKEDRRGDDT